MVGASAVVPAVHRGSDPVTVPVRESQQKAFNGLQAAHFRDNSIHLAKGQTWRGGLGGCWTPTAHHLST